ncbi:MAG: MmgE/PrpD family protein [Nitrospinota bacterium]|nr:MmgE/PrpD family protein [Nitrospinota bacterium]
MAFATDDIVDFSKRLNFEDIPPEVVEKTKYLLLDALGIAIASTALPVSSQIKKMVFKILGLNSSDLSKGVNDGCTVIGEKIAMPVTYASMINGSLIHSLDFDDTHTKSVIHNCAPLVPSALSGAELFHPNTRDFLKSLILGFEFQIRLGLVAPGAFHARGFHMTSIAGTFGSSLVFGLLAGFSKKAIVSALGICGSLSSGLFEYLEDGSPVKIIHPGWASQSGIVAAMLANEGFGGPSSILEGRFGLYKSHVYGEDLNLKVLTSGLGSKWETLNIAYKPYPCGHVIHAFLDAAKRIYSMDKYSVDDIKSIKCLAAKGAIDLVLEPLESKKNPRSPYDAKFSLPYCIGSILARGSCNTVDFSEDSIQESKVLKVASLVNYEEDPSQNFPEYFPGSIEIAFKNGKKIIEHEKFQRGCLDNPMSNVDIEKKFLDNSLMVFDMNTAKELLDIVMQLDKLGNISSLLSLLRF